MATTGPSPVSPPGSCWIFDRDQPAHPWHRALQELCEPAADMRWLVGTNWRMDHRVSEAREDDLKTTHFATVGGKEEWWEALAGYFRGELCLPCLASAPPPISALIRTNNANNLIPVLAPHFDRLVHVASLSNILRRVARGPLAADVSSRLIRIAGRGLPVRPVGPVDPATWFPGAVRELAVSLERRGSDAIRMAAGVLADALGETEPFWWACFADEVKIPLRTRDSAELCARLGLGHLRSGDWLLVWSYTVGEAEPIYRPTAVEANDSPYHFPSPPDYEFGITMSLNIAAGACREVVHRPLKGTATSKYSVLLLELNGFNPAISSEDIAKLRATHASHLRHEFPAPETLEWLDRHPSSSI